jgi:hypothetical protein
MAKVGSAAVDVFELPGTCVKCEFIHKFSRDQALSLKQATTALRSRLFSVSDDGPFLSFLITLFYSV